MVRYFDRLHVNVKSWIEYSIFDENNDLRICGYKYLMIWSGFKEVETVLVARNYCLDEFILYR